MERIMISELAVNWMGTGGGVELDSMAVADTGAGVRFACCAQANRINGINRMDRSLAEIFEGMKNVS